MEAGRLPCIELQNAPKLKSNLRVNWPPFLRRRWPTLCDQIAVHHFGATLGEFDAPREVLDNIGALTVARGALIDYIREKGNWRRSLDTVDHNAPGFPPSTIWA